MSRKVFRSSSPRSAGGESRGGVPSTEMTENEADERLGMAFPLDLPPFIAHFPAHRKRISCYEPSREITTGSNFEAQPRRDLRDFQILTIPPGPLFKRAWRALAGCREAVGPRRLALAVPSHQRPSYSLAPRAGGGASSTPHRIGRQRRVGRLDALFSSRAVPNCPRPRTHRRASYGLAAGSIGPKGPRNNLARVPKGRRILFQPNRKLGSPAH